MKVKNKQKIALAVPTKRVKPLLRVVSDVGEPLSVTDIRLVPDDTARKPPKSTVELMATGGLELLVGGLLWFFDHYKIVRK